MSKFSIAILLLFFSTSVNANSCSTYEMRIFDLIDEAKTFQHTNAFKEYGWSAAGPTNDWLNRFQSIRNDASDREFFAKYGFIIAEVYQVADEYRTTGFLDSFYQDIENEINNAKRCK